MVAGTTTPRKNEEAMPCSYCQGKGDPNCVSSLKQSGRLDVLDDECCVCYFKRTNGHDLISEEKRVNDGRHDDS